MREIDMGIFGINNCYESYLQTVERNRDREIVKTPWSNLNEKLGGGLYAGLYCIGAISSLGKTAFCLQMADFIAESGHPVIFYSLEMPVAELISRSISRLTFLDNPMNNENLSTNQILYGKCDLEKFAKYTNQYFDKATFLNLQEGDFMTSVNTIEKHIVNFVDTVKVKPVVFIDYLQVVKPKIVLDSKGNEKYMNERQEIENVVINLKQLSKKYDLTIFVISSFNRSNYSNSVSFESFKESGLIEYTSDVVMGLQLRIIDDVNNKDNNLKDKLKIAKEKNPREVKLVILKQRNGKIL